MRKRQFVWRGVMALILFSSGVVLAQDARTVAKKVFPSVVILEMKDVQNRTISIGSGFFVRPDVVATNLHVVKGAASGSTTLSNRKSYQIEGVVALDRDHDLVLLKVVGVSGAPIKFGDLSKLEVGQSIFALGSPKGLEGTISAGIISGSNLRIINKEKLIQITAPISPGSSGGPVVDSNGELVGVAVASLPGGQNLNFAIPATYLAALLVSAPLPSMPLSRVGESDRRNASPMTGPSMEETVGWLKKTLLVSYESLGFVVKDLDFANCNLRLETQKSNVATREVRHVTAYARLEYFDNAFLPEPDTSVMLSFSTDKAVRYSGQVFQNGKPMQAIDHTDGLMRIRTGDKTVSLRVMKAFEHLSKLCKDEVTKEPF